MIHIRTTFTALSLIALTASSTSALAISPPESGLPSCFGKLEAVTEVARDANVGGTEVVTVLRCQISDTYVDSAERIYRYFAEDSLKRLKDKTPPAPMNENLPIFGTKVMQDSVPAVAYDIHPTGANRAGKTEGLFADGRLYIARDLPAGSDRVTLAFITSAIHTSGMTKIRGGFLVKAINGRSEYVQDPITHVITVTAVNYVRISISGSVAQKKATDTGKSKLVEKIQEGLRDLVSARALPASQK